MPNRESVKITSMNYIYAIVSEKNFTTLNYIKFTKEENQKDIY